MIQNVAFLGDNRSLPLLGTHMVNPHLVFPSNFHRKVPCPLRVPSL